MRRTLSVLFSIMFVLGAVLGPVAPVMAQISLFPTLSVSPLDPQIVEVEVTPSSIGSANFVGNVTVTKIPWGTVTVNLDANVSSGWPATVSPTEMEFTSPGSEVFTVVVVVPQATSADEIGGVTVTGIMTYRGGTSTAESTGTVCVREFIMFTPSFSTQIVKTNPAEVSLKVLNEGNGREAFKVELQNANKIRDRGITIEMSKTQTEEIDPFGFDNITMKIRYDGTKVSGDMVYATFKVSSLSAENISKDVVLTINLQKEGLGTHIELLLEHANARIDPPLELEEVRRYYREDARTWSLLLRLRRADRFWQRKVRGRTYPFLLPGPIQR